MNKDQIIQICTNSILYRGYDIRKYTKKFQSKFWGYHCMISAIYDCNKSLILDLILNHNININNTPNNYMCILKDAFGALKSTYRILPQAIDIIHILLEHVEDINMDDSIGTTVLSHLIKVNDYNIIRQLIHLLWQYGLDINIRDDHGRTILMNLCIQKATHETNELFEILITRYGASVHIVDNYGYSLLRYAIMAYDAEFGDQILQLLLQKYNVSVDVVDSGNGLYPLWNFYASPFKKKSIPFEIHSLLWSPQNISNHDNYYGKNAIQHLCRQLYHNRNRTNHLYDYLTDVLSRFRDINILYDAITYKSGSKYDPSVFEYITTYGSQEHKDLLQIIYCKHKRAPLLIYIDAIKKSDNALSPHCNKIQLLFHKMGIKFGMYYIPRQILKNMGKLDIE